jgi:hypothetical protein
LEWALQLQYGTGVFEDNASQFKVTAEAGDVFEVVFVPTTGDVTIFKNGAVDATAQVKWDTKSENGELPIGTWATLADAKANFVYADAEAVFSIVGSPELAGIEWSAENAAYIVSGTDGTYKKVVMATKDGDFEFKVIQDGPDMAWAYQMQLGKSEFIDNASQFKVSAVAGDVFEITFTPANGDLNITKNGEAYDYLVRWATKDEDPKDFLTKEEALKQFVKVEDTTDKKEDTTEKKEDTTEKKEDTTTAKKEDTTTAKNQATQTGDSAPVALLFLLVAAVAVVTVVAKKKEA